MKRLLSVLALAAAVCALTPGAAAAAGTSTIDLGGKAVKSLRSQGVEIAGYGGASARRKRVVLRIRSGLVSSSALLNQRGGLACAGASAAGSARSSSAACRCASAGRARSSAQVGSRRFAIFGLKAVSRTLSLDAGRERRP